MVTRPEVALREFDTVRVVELHEPSRSFDGTSGVARPPRVGDVGAVVHILDPDGPTAPVIVESVNDKGETVWLAEFSRDELTPVGPSNHGPT